jgi:hypothetical protein
VLVTTANPERPQIQVVADRSGNYYGQPMLAGRIYTIAGSGALGYMGDGVPAVRAALSSLDGIVYWAHHGVLVEDNDKLRLIYPPANRRQLGPPGRFRATPTCSTMTSQRCYRPNLPARS